MTMRLAEKYTIGHNLKYVTTHYVTERANTLILLPDNHWPESYMREDRNQVDKE